MPYKILFRCNAGRRIGSGHLSRCLTLANALRKKNIECSFLITDIIEPVKNLIEKNGFIFSEFPFVSLYDDFLRTTDIFCKDQYDFLILDGYDFDNDYLENVHNKGIPYMYMDDMINLKYKCTYVFNQNFYAKKENFNALPDTKFLLGPYYALLRDEFIVSRTNLSRNYPEKAQNILVTFGGSDSTNETMKVLNAVELIDSHNLKIKVIVGCMNPHLEDIRECTGGIKKHQVEVLYNITNISEEMVWADLVVSNAGTTCMELCSLGLTGLVIVVADNQILIGKTLNELNLFHNLGFYDNVSPSLIARKLELLINDASLRKSMSEKCLSMVDGRGAERVVNEIEKYCRMNS